jgi:hypothetical protein
MFLSISLPPRDKGPHLGHITSHYQFRRPPCTRKWYELGPVVVRLELADNILCLIPNSIGNLVPPYLPPKIIGLPQSLASRKLPPAVITASEMRSIKIAFGNQVRDEL